MSVLSNVIGRQPGQAVGLFGLSLALPKAVHSATRLVGFVIGALLAAAVLLVAVATVPTLFGYHTYVVTSGSMEPALRTGSIAVTSPTKPIGLDVGDIIAYHPAKGGTRVLHRIVKIEEVDGQRRFITQGDSNAAADPTPVTLEGAGDRVVYSVPYAGYVVGFAQGWGGRFLLIGAPAVLLAFIIGRDARRRPMQPAAAECSGSDPATAAANVLDVPKRAAASSLPLATAGSSPAAERALRFMPSPRLVEVPPRQKCDLRRTPPLTFVRRGGEVVDGLPVFRRVSPTSRELHAA